MPTFSSARRNCARQAPGDATDPKSTRVEFPLGDILLRHAIDPIGDKFCKSDALGPAGQKGRIPNLDIVLSNTVDILIGDPR